MLPLFQQLLLLLHLIGLTAVASGVPHRLRTHGHSHQERDGQLLPWSRFRAVTVVHEPCSTLGFTLTNMAGNLGPDWPVLVYYTPRARVGLEENKVVQYMVAYGGLTLLPIAALQVPGMDELNHVNEYSQLLTRPEFWRSLRADKALIFQVDSVICSGSNFTINHFLAYDYIGAPWTSGGRKGQVDNGGFSLRSVDHMFTISQVQANRSPHPEDYFFADGIKSMAAHGEAVVQTPTEAAQQFAWETGPPPLVTPFAVHRCRGSALEHRAAIAQLCPEARIGVWSSCGRTS